MAYVAFGCAALLGGLLQGVTGFGSGVIMMMALPFLYAIPESAAISSLSALALTVSMAWRYRQSISLKKVLFPAVPYLACSAVAICFSTVVDQETLKTVFGAFLIVLAGYNFMTMGRAKTNALSLPARLGCVVFSGVCDGLFGIGGPLMVLYFLSQTEGQEEYLGTNQLFFMINLIFSSSVRAARGILTLELMPMVVLGAVCLVLGLQIANRVLGRLDRDAVLKITYGAIALCGITNII